jgi:uncharacterized repeat protein (TIGR03803 family)
MHLSTAQALKLTSLASFNGADGEFPNSPLVLSGSTLYGTTLSGGGAGSDGVVFSESVTGGNPTVLATFTGINAGGMGEGLILSGNTLYGTVVDGGASGDGQVFSVPVTGGTPTILATFTGTNGDGPVGGLLLSGNTLYGTTAAGGANGDGEVFSLPITGGSPKILASFDGTNGSEPRDLTISGSTLYGNTVDSVNGDGEIYSLPIAGGVPTVLTSFNGTNGKAPNSGLTLSGNTLYGITIVGGAYGDGEVFSVPVSGGNPTVLTSFNLTNGAYPVGGLTLSGNILYGTTSGAGPGGGVDAYGEVFSLPTTGGSPTALVYFNQTNGSAPFASLTLSGNTLYGTTLNGGANGDGTIFSLSLQTIVALSATSPGTYGNSQGSLAITSSNGSYKGSGESIVETTTGYIQTSAWNPATNIEIYALDISDSAPTNLPEDLAALVSQIDSDAYSGYWVSASKKDPTSGEFLAVTPGNYNLYVTVISPSLGASSHYFGFDLSQFAVGTDVLTVSAIAVVPEPTAGFLLVAGSGAFLLKRRSVVRSRASLFI